MCDRSVKRGRHGSVVRPASSWRPFKGGHKFLFNWLKCFNEYLVAYPLSFNQIMTSMLLLSSFWRQFVIQLSLWRNNLSVSAVIVYYFSGHTLIKAWRSIPTGGLRTNDSHARKSLYGDRAWLCRCLRALAIPPSPLYHTLCSSCFIALSCADFWLLWRKRVNFCHVDVTRQRLEQTHAARSY